MTKQIVAWTVVKDWGADEVSDRTGGKYAYPPEAVREYDLGTKYIDYLVADDDGNVNFTGKVLDGDAIEFVMDWAARDVGSTMLFLKKEHPGAVGEYAIVKTQDGHIIKKRAGGAWGMVIG